LKKPHAKTTPKRRQGLPDKPTLLAFLREAGEAEKTDIARAFGLKGDERRALREMLKELQTEGALAKRGRRGLAEAGALPPVGVADVVHRDADGDLYVRLTKGEDDTAPVRLAASRDEAKKGAPGMGDRLLVRFETLENGEVEARLIKKLGGQGATKVLGVIRRGHGEVRVEPVDRKSKDRFILLEAKDYRDGDLVVVTPAGSDSRYGPRRAKVLEVVGREDDPRAASLVAIHSHGIPTGFSPAAEDEAEQAQPPVLKGREDLRHIPFVTIDPVDARDHDDAVYAEPDDKGGWVVWVAIADVAAYVRPGTSLDREALDKGNSVYFPDRVEPMLPEVLSNGMCSLREGEPRATLAVRMAFNQAGQKTGHTFHRGLMRSAAKLSYQQAQAAIDGEPDDKTGPLLDTILKPLWQAHACLGRGRAIRSPLAIESAERRVQIDKDGKVASIQVRETLEAMKLIEEMMIQANVCAAESLEKAKLPLIYRIHDTPSQEKMQNLGDFLATIDMPWSKGEAPRTDRFNKLLAETRDGPHAEIVNEVVLRSQMQAIYSPDNIGHFGLNLMKYAHFTSPIRRYADLIVHRALIRALKLGDDGLTDQEISHLSDIAESISFAERRAMQAERDATDRYVAAFLADRVGAEFEGRVTGVTRFGLFVRLTETGADGLVPVSSLGDEYFIHDDRAHALIGERTGGRYPLGMMATVKLMEATPITGGLVFAMVSEPMPRDPNAPAPRLGVRKHVGNRPNGPAGRLSKHGPKGGKGGGGKKGGKRR
jgi:ribonuclease R